MCVCVCLFVFYIPSTARSFRDGILAKDVKLGIYIYI